MNVAVAEVVYVQEFDLSRPVYGAFRSTMIFDLEIEVTSKESDVK